MAGRKPNRKIAFFSMMAKVMISFEYLYIELIVLIEDIASNCNSALVKRIVDIINYFSLDLFQLCWRNLKRWRSPAAGSGSDGGTDAVGSQVQRLFMWSLGVAVMSGCLLAALGTPAMLCFCCDHPCLHWESEALVVFIRR